MTLEYTREYRTYFHVASSYGVSESSCYKGIKWIEDVLIKHPNLQNTQKRQKYWYSGKKKRHTLKTQVVIDKKTKRVICTAFANGKRHDFRLFKESRTHIHPDIKVITDTGYQGIQRLHSKAELPKKRTKKNPLTKENRRRNQELARERVVNENVIGMLKRFKDLRLQLISIEIDRSQI